MKQISFETVFFFEYGIYYSKMDFYQGGNRMKRTIRIGIVYCILTSLVTACSSVSANASNTTLINVSKNQASTEIEESVSLSGNDKVTPAASVENPSSRNLYFYVSALADDAKLYSSVDELSNDADLIITGKVVNQENYFHMDMIYQLAFVKVESVRKGGIQVGDTILVSQRGGYATYKEWTEGTHFEPKEGDGDPTVDMDQIIAFGYNGYYPITMSDEVLLFLKETDNPYENEKGDIYAPLSGYSGVFYRSGDEYVFPSAFQESTCSAQAWKDHLKKNALLKSN